MKTTARRTSELHTAPGFAATLSSEWIKLWTLRFTGVMLILALALAAASAAVFLLTTGVTREESLARMPAYDVVGTGLLGVDFANLVFIVLSASAVASEHSSGMITATLSATPHRLRVLTAKAAVLTATALFVGVLAVLTTFGVGDLVLLAKGLPTLDVGDPQVLGLLLGSTLIVPFYSLLAVAFAFITRNAGAAVAAVLVVMSVPALVGVLPEWWQTILLPFLPASALHSLSGAASQGSLEYLAPGAAILVLVTWAVVPFFTAYIALSRRDV